MQVWWLIARARLGTHGSRGNRANRMFLVEVWHDRTAYDAHVMADHTRALRAKLLPFQGALYDERLYNVVR